MSRYVKPPSLKPNELRDPMPLFLEFRVTVIAIILLPCRNKCDKPTKKEEEFLPSDLPAFRTWVRSAPPLLTTFAFHY